MQGILFDLDGTVLDSAPDLVASLNWVRASEGLPALALAEIRPHASRGAAGLLRAGMPAADAGTFEDWKLRFLAHYAENSFVASALYPGMTDLFEYLHRLELPWGIVTNKSQALTWPILRASGLAEVAGCVVCGDSLERGKPDPAPVLYACERIGTEPRATLFAGDDQRDFEAGRAAGTMTAAVLYGYGSDDLSTEAVASSFQVHEPGDFLRLVRSLTD